MSFVHIVSRGQVRKGFVELWVVPELAFEEGAIGQFDWVAEAAVLTLEEHA